ncbi:MAG TPA: metal ABC transporter permease [Myxococcota bacterium]|jgi:zinc transport system permease protein|nr:metal ABC transporter permease [Myxococcota bacterium]
MFEWWTKYEFMRNAIVGGALVGGMCSLLGVLVLQRGLAFLGEGLAHAAFGGVALGLLLDLGVRFHMDWLGPVWVAVPFCVCVAMAIGWVRNRGVATEGTAVGIFFSVSVALGILFVFIREKPSGDLESYLFGSLLAVRRVDVFVSAGLAALILLVLGATWTKMAYITFDRELAKLSGINVEALDYLLLAMMACVIVLSVKTVGVILVSSYLIIPAATARLMGGSLFGMTVKSVIVGVLGSTVGLVFSYYINVPSGATVILTLAAGFSATLLVRGGAALQGHSH